MTNGKKIATTATILCILSLSIYALARIKLFEKEYSKNLTVSSEGIAKSYRESPKDEQSLNLFLKSTLKKYNNIAMIALSDKNSYIKFIKKNDTYIKTPFLHDSILNDFTENKISISTETAPAVRYYNSDAGKNDNLRLYIFVKKIGDERLLTVFPYEINSRLYVKFALEVLLIIVLFTISGAAYYILSSKNSKESEKISASYKHKTTEEPDSGIKFEQSETRTGEKEQIEHVVFALFKNIYKNHAVSSLYLHLKNSRGELARSFELKGKSFIKIDSDSYDTIDSKGSLTRELQSSAYLIQENGKKISIPLNGKKGLLGILTAGAAIEFSGNEISSISEYTSSVAPLIEKYFDIPEAGDKTQDTSSFMKEFYIAESEKRSAGSDFSVALITFDEKESRLLDSELKPMIDITVSAIKEKTGRLSFVEVDGKTIKLILKNHKGIQAVEAIKNIEREISKFRIKLENGKTVTLNPRCGISSSDTAQSIDSMLKYAEEDMQRHISITTGKQV